LFQALPDRDPYPLKSSRQVFAHKMAQPSRASHYNRRLVGDEIKEFDLSYRLSRHLREGNARQVDKMLADGASIEGSTLVEYRPLMEAAGTISDATKNTVLTTWFSCCVRVD